MNQAMFVVKMAASGCHLTEVFVRLRSVLLLFILPTCNFVPWFLVDGSVGTAAVGMQSYETDFQTFRVNSSSPFSVFKVAVPPEPMDPICQALINNFTESSVLYTRCILQNAKTYKGCQRCVDEYLEVDKSYQLLRQEFRQQNNSTPRRCTEIYPGMAEVNVFSDVYNFVQDSWKAGGCQNCFSWFGINSTNVGTLTETAQTFLSMSELFLSCIFNESLVYTLQEDVSSNLLLNRVQNDSNMTVCTRCKGAYKSLNEFYVSNFELIFDKDAHICTDISDLMNFTRYMWQELYKCPIQHASVWPVTVASVVLCFLPVVFYIATKVFGHDVERTMVQQKRFRRRSGSSSTVRNSMSDIGNHLSM